MTQQLTVLLLEQNNQPRLLGTLVSERITIGRECPQGISVDVAGVSRSHGEFLRVRSQFVFIDLGSTNGTWINGRKLEARRPVVMRAGDTLQLAAAPLKIGAEGGVKSEVPSLLVMRTRGELLDYDSDGDGAALISVEEFPIPAAGNVMTLGGAQSDVDGCSSEIAARVTKEDGGLTLEVLSDLVALNGTQPSGPRVPIGDNDVISVDGVRVVVNIPPRLSSASIARPVSVFGTPLSNSAGGFVSQTSGAGGLSQREDRDVAGTAVFPPGALDAHINPEATTAVFDGVSIREAHSADDGARMGGVTATAVLATGEMHPSSRFGETAAPEDSGLGLSPLEVKLVIIMAIMLFASVFLLGLWWFSGKQ